MFAFSFSPFTVTPRRVSASFMAFLTSNVVSNFYSCRSRVEVLDETSYLFFHFWRNDVWKFMSICMKHFGRVATRENIEVASTIATTFGELCNFRRWENDETEAPSFGWWHVWLNEVLLLFHCLRFWNFCRLRYLSWQWESLKVFQGWRRETNKTKKEI
jgi:hypothetical protein